MEINKPQLFIEVDDTEFKFLVVKYNENLSIDVIYFNKISADGVLNGKIIDIDISSKIFKEQLNILEKKINYFFKDAFIIVNFSDFQSINISGYKKLNGSQILTEDISFILNDIKKLVLDTNQNLSIIHLFNSNYILDSEIVNKLPVGLYGEFYNQHMTFFLTNKNNIKNLKLVLNNCDIDIKRVIFKPFAMGVNNLLVRELNNTYIFIYLSQNKSNIFIFKNSSLSYSESFLFGTDIIQNDVSKLCSLDKQTVRRIFADVSFDELLNNGLKKKEYLEKKYFEGTNYRKISFGHLNDILTARIEEIINIIFTKNNNLKYINNENVKMQLIFNDKNILNNLNDIFKKCLINNTKIEILESIEENEKSSLLGAAELAVKGWEKEAIPFVESEKSFISRIFSYLFH